LLREIRIELQNDSVVSLSTQNNLKLPQPIPLTFRLIIAPAA
jgi:hypothetical protein